MATIQVRVDDTMKLAADALFSSLGIDTGAAVRMFISAAIQHRGIPFDIRKPNITIEINDGHGSYICEHGHLHDYSRKPAKYEISGSFSSYGDYLKAMNEDLSDGV